VNTDARREAMLLDAACAASETETLADLGRSALPLLADALGAAETMLYGLTPDGRPARYGGTFYDVFETYKQEFMARDPQQEALVCYNPPIARASRYLNIEAFRRSEIYRRSYLEFGVAHIVQCRLDGDTYLAPGMAALALFRRADQHDWGNREERALARVMPAFRAAARRATQLAPMLRAHPIVESMVDAADPRPRLALDSRGAILWISSRAAALLGDPRRVPEALARAARPLDAQQEAPSAVEVCVRARSGERLWCELQRARAGDGASFISVSIHEYSLPSAGLAALAAQARLTRAETSVLAVLSLGMPNREIARRLFISVETVRTHVGRILRKLEVGSRSEAILRVRGAAPRSDE
jgi:DNA-binding CsgD family transcriptional regulator